MTLTAGLGQFPSSDCAYVTSYYAMDVRSTCPRWSSEHVLIINTASCSHSMPVELRQQDDHSSHFAGEQTQAELDTTQRLNNKQLSGLQW